MDRFLMKKILFFVSGGGGNLKFIAELINHGFFRNCRLIVISDRHCPALEYSLRNNIESYQISYSRKDNLELKELLRKINPDVIVTNWHKIIDKEIVSIYYGKLINLHYSLLPSFAGYIGMKPLELALERKCRVVGATCHHVNEQVDEGVIIAQSCFISTGEFYIDSEKMFRAGCFSLAVGINSKIKVVEGSCDSVSRDGYVISPGMELSFVSDGFWESIKKA